VRLSRWVIRVFCSEVLIISRRRITSCVSRVLLIDVRHCIDIGSPLPFGSVWYVYSSVCTSEESIALEVVDGLDGEPWLGELRFLSFRSHRNSRNNGE